jgi:putative aldouronate transport system permease protein
MPALTLNSNAIKRQQTPNIVQKKEKISFWKKLLSQKQLALMSLPLVVYVIIFSYIPLYGWLMAFQDYTPGKSILNQEWVGFKQFYFLFTSGNFLRVLRNTIAMSLINLVLGFVTSIGFALLLNEIKNTFIKKSIQTISYLPYFISWVITAGIVSTSLALDGSVNNVLVFLHLIKEPVQWLAIGQDFWAIFGLINIWKNVGFSAIIYLGSMAAIDPALYESAQLDGASRMQKMWHITLPGIKSTFVILLIMSISNVLNAGFEPQYLLGYGTNVAWSETIDVFVMKYGINLGNYSLSTAAGMFKTVVSIFLLFLANGICSKLGEEKLI